MNSGGLVDLIPAWWRVSLLTAARIYGSLTLPLVLEAEYDSSVRKSLIDMYLFGDLHSYDQYLYTWGLPDWRSARLMCGLDIEDVAIITMRSVETITAMEHGWIGPDFGMLLEMCDHLEWPLGILFRSNTDWHPLTVLSRRYRYRLGGAR